VNTKNIKALKGYRPIVATTAYDAVLAKLADQSGVDILLVGDSVGTTQLGFNSTVQVTLDMMIHHTAAVSRINPNALVVADMPFGYSFDDYETIFNSCRKLIQEGGASAVKIEGGLKLALTIQRLVDSGIPVLGHIGLLPQLIKIEGGYRKFGKSAEEKKSLIADAQALEAAGCFAIIGEMIESEVSKKLTETIEIPFIGIGSGPYCDGQILVSNDLLGFSTEKVPSFVQIFGKVSEEVSKAFNDYKKAVIGRNYPNE